MDRNPLFVALDVDDLGLARRLAALTSPYVGGFKIGPRLSLKGGPEFIKELSTQGSVFLDHKYFDIPNTMESAVRASFESGAQWVTVHAQAGHEALKRLALVEDEFRQKGRSVQVLAVTVLTSFDQQGLPEVSRAMPIHQQVSSLAQLVRSSGLSGLVASGQEVQELRRLWPESFIVVPGVRISGDSLGDQKRVLDPQAVMRLGASALVVGRPIIEAKDPAAAAKQYADAIRSVELSK